MMNDSSKFPPINEAADEKARRSLSENVIVAVKAGEKVVSKAALAWALAHVVHPRDCVILLAVFQGARSSRRLWSWRRLNGDCRNSDDCANLPDRICQISESCSRMVLQFQNQFEQLLVAGVDTASVTLTWALSLLLNHPKALKIAQDEIDEHVGRNRLVEESDLKNLLYLDAIIKETFRLYPAAPLSAPHESMEDCIVGGYNIPKGTRLLVNHWKIQCDPNIWSEPYKFKPERFLISHKDIDVKGNHYELLPFGSGRRMCPGVFFTSQALGLTLASLIQQFVLKKPSNEPVDMTESMGMTNGKATPLEVLLAPRLSSDMYYVGS